MGGNVLNLSFKAARKSQTEALSTSHFPESLEDYAARVEKPMSEKQAHALLAAKVKHRQELRHAKAKLILGQ